MLSCILRHLVSCGLGGAVLWVSLSQLIFKYRQANNACASTRHPVLDRPFPLLLASFFIISQLRIYMMSSLLSPKRWAEVRGRYFKEEVEEGTCGVPVRRGFEESAQSAKAAGAQLQRLKVELLNYLVINVHPLGSNQNSCSLGVCCYRGDPKAGGVAIACVHCVQPL